MPAEKIVSPVLDVVSATFTVAVELLKLHAEADK
jgi:hypothetical protein